MSSRPVKWGTSWGRRGTLAWLLAAAAGVAMRLWFIAHAPKVMGDSLIYGELAANWLRHGVYGLTRGAGEIHVTLIRLPGYPLFLAMCFRVFGIGNYAAVMGVQLGVDLVSCGLIAATAAALLGRRAGWAALWLAVLCPFTASYVGAPLTETLSIFCVAAAFLGLARWRVAGCKTDGWVGLTGLALAYAVLLRPEQGLLAAAVVPAMAWLGWQGRRTLAPAVLAAAITVAPLGPWALRNWRDFHIFQPLAPKNANDPGEFVPVGFQRWYRTWGMDFISTDQVYWNYDNDAIRVTDLPARAFDSADEYARTAALLRDYNVGTSATPALDVRFAALAEERVRAHRARYYVLLPLARVANMLLRPRTELLALPLDWWRWGKGWRAAAGLGIWNLAYLGLAALGLWRWRPRDAVVWSMVGFCVLRCGLLATIDNSEPRYTLELFPVLIVWASRLAAGRGGLEPPKLRG